ncbi:unnamed protein product [Closterium sp. NIES-53]
MCSYILPPFLHSHASLSLPRRHLPRLGSRRSHQESHSTVSDYELHSLDFSTAFLQGSLHEEIWLRRPPGFTGLFPPGTQWSLRRPVYGLRQAPREWHDTLRTTLAALGFAPSTADPSLFLRTDTSLPPFYILVYVDDLVFATADTAGLAHVKAQRTITLTQSHMVQQVLQRFDFTYSSPQATPLSTSHSLSALPSEPSGPYPALVGCLMYLMTCTRPDLAYPLSILARYVAPGRHRPEHMAAAKRVLRYLCSTSGMGLVLGERRPVVLTGHADASWADDQATQRSSQGYTFSLGSGSVSWRSTRSSSVLSSSCEAEIYAGAMAAQELRWLTYLLTDLGELPRSAPVLYVDNKAMLALCREHRLEHRTKHIALRYFLARELQQRGQLRLAYVAFQANTADIFTKALPPGDHQRFCTMLEGLGYNLLSISQLMAKGIHLEADSTTQEFKLYNGKGGLYIGKAVLKNNVFVLDFVPDLGTADSDGIVTFTSWTHPPDLDPEFSPEGFCSKDNIDSSRDNIGKDNIDSSKDNIDSSKDNIGKDNILSSTDNIGSSRDNIGSNRNNGSSSSNIDTNRWSLNCIGSNRRHSTDSCAAA